MLSNLDDPGHDGPVLRLEDRWIWDSWMADDREHYHLFYLQAPRSLGDPGRRHRNATVGHARSRDLVDWEVLPDALRPTEGGWDDLAIWTGSVVRGDDGVWRMFYTAINTRGHDLKDQRIGWSIPRTCSPGAGTATRRCCRSTRVGTRRSPTIRRPARPGVTPWSSPTRRRRVAHVRLRPRRGAPPHDDGVLAHARSHDLPPGTRAARLRAVTAEPSPRSPWVLVFTCAPMQQRDGTSGAGGLPHLEAHGVDGFEILDPIPCGSRTAS